MSAEVNEHNLRARVYAKFLRTLLDFEVELEDKKVALLENHLFSPFVAFQYFDRFGQGYATRADVHHFFESHPLDLEGSPLSAEDIDFAVYAQGRVHEGASSLSRPDGFFYEHFLNLLTPADGKKLTQNLAGPRDFHAGKAKQLSAYVFDMFLELLKLQVRCFRALQTIKTEMIAHFGYTAHPAFKLVAGDADRVCFAELRQFLVKHGQEVTEREFCLLAAVVEGAGKKHVSKTGFLNLFTPFDGLQHRRVADRSYESLARNPQDLQQFVANSFGHREEPGRSRYEDPRLKEAARLMQTLYSNHSEVDRYAKRHLSVTEDGKVTFDLRKKHFAYYNVSGFKECFDQYHKGLYHEAKSDAHRFLLTQPYDKLKANLADEDLAPRQPRQKNSALDKADSISLLKAFFAPNKAV